MTEGEETNCSRVSRTSTRIMWPALLLLMWGGVSLAGSQCERSSAVRFSVSSWRNQTGHRLVAAEMRSDDSLEDAVSLSVDQWTERCGAAGTVALSVTASSAGSSSAPNISGPTTLVPTTSVQTTSVLTTPTPTTTVPTTDTNVTVRPAPRPDYRHLPGLGYYKLHSNSSSWEVARSACESEGAHLAILDSREEYKNLYELSGCCPWVGIYRQDPSRPWVTVLDQPLKSSFNAWGEDEPSGGGDCAFVTSSGGIVNYACYSIRRFFCELKV